MVKGQVKSLRITLEATETGVLGYVYLRDVARGQAVKTVELEPGSIMADYDDKGRLLGVEFLNAENGHSNVMRGLAERLNAPELAAIDLAEMCKAPA